MFADEAGGFRNLQRTHRDVARYNVGCPVGGVDVGGPEGGGPFDTKTVTTDPSGTFVPVSGLTPMTSPDGVTGSEASISIGTRPVDSTLANASARASHCTDGTRF